MHIWKRRQLFFLLPALVVMAPLMWQSASIPGYTLNKRSLSLSAASATSPPDKMLVVTTNLRAAWGNQDDMPLRMSRYVDRLLNQAPYYPDVLLLQEVKKSSANRVAALLSNRTGNQYVVAVRPPRVPWTQTRRHRIETDSAIIIDRTTTTKLDPGGYISLTYDRSDAADRTKRVEINRHARVSVAEISGNMRMSLASVHYQYQLLKSRSLRPFYQKRWSRKVTRKLKVKYPGTIHTVGGDFNSDRCVTPGGPGTCRKSAFWRIYVNRKHYLDSIFKVWRDGGKNLGLGGFDFIFTKGNPLDAHTDRTYNKDDSSTFYSDHRFVWALIGP